jgi:long-chain acyl-CoA synthetase
MVFLLLLPAVISFGGVTNDHKDEAKNYGLSIFSWEEFLIMVSL